jgi:TonB family protein
MRTFAIVACLLAALAANNIQASDLAAASFVKGILDQVKAKQEPCSDRPEGIGTGTIWTCGRVTSDFETFSAELDKAIPKIEGLTAPAEPLTGWITQKTARMRWYEVSDKWVVITYEGSNRKVLTSYPKDREGVYNLVKGVVPPKRVLEEVPPLEKTREARGGLKPGAQGTVVVSAIVKKDGTVSDAEVIGCVPRFMGLEQAALRAIKKWRYDPGKKDDATVDVALTATMSYGSGGSFRAVEAYDYNKIGQPSAPSQTPPSPR